MSGLHVGTTFVQLHDIQEADIGSRVLTMHLDGLGGSALLQLSQNVATGWAKNALLQLATLSTGRRRDVHQQNQTYHALALISSTCARSCTPQRLCRLGLPLTSHTLGTSLSSRCRPPARLAMTVSRVVSSVAERHVPTCSTEEYADTGWFEWTSQPYTLVRLGYPVHALVMLYKTENISLME